MSKLMSILRRAPKRTFAVIAIIAAAIIIPATLLAWGPIRPTFTMENPADYVTFNSIIDNPNIGDERNFVGIRETGTDNKWSDNMTVQDGKQYTVRMYVHNNAAANLNLIARNVTAKFYLPTNTAKSLQVNGFVNSTNATPKEVYDHAIFSSSQDFNLAYVSKSLIFENNAIGKDGGVALSESIFTSTGAKLGYTKLDGNIPGCIQYAGYVSFTVKPQFAKTNSFTMSKMVSKHGDNKWVESYKAQPGETIDYLIQYKNTGQTQQDNVTVRDTLPVGETYVTGSTTYGNSKYPSGVAASDNIANGIGINIGSYAPGANAWVIFSAKIVDNDELAICGDNKLVNKAKVTTGGGSIEDTADVVVPKECQSETPVYTCDLLTAKLISDNKYEFNGKATAKNGATIKDYKFDFGDSSSKTVTIPTDVEHTYADEVASYTARLYVTVNVDDTEKTVTSDACTVKITVDETPSVTTSVTPSELPTTGVGADISAFLGLGSLVTSVGYYRASRRRI